MDFLIICLAAFLTSGLTLFSGFGLGTLLMPVFALFLPVDIAVSLTALVHFLNNLFKLVLVGRKADRSTVIRFGIPAIVAAFAGAQFLFWLADGTPWFRYHLFDQELFILPVKFVIAILMIGFALFELVPRLDHLSFDEKYLPWGGVISGFFGGLSGHQGALRSAFLVRSGLAKENFIATGVVIACLVDLSRISVYIVRFSTSGLKENITILGAATLSAFLGAYLGNRFIKKVTMKMVQRLVSVLLLGIAFGLGMGIL